MSGNVSSPSDTVWLLDSGAQISVTGCLSSLDDVQSCSSRSIIGPNGTYQTTSVGTFYLRAISFNDEMLLSLRVYYVPNLPINLLSLSSIYQHNPTIGDITLGRTHAYFRLHDSTFVLGGVTKAPHEGLWEISSESFPSTPSDSSLLVAAITKSHDLLYWHHTLGHCSPKRLLGTLAEADIHLTSRELAKNTDCDLCGPSKCAQQPMHSDQFFHVPRSNRRLATLFADTSGSIRVHQSTTVPSAPRKRGRPKRGTTPTPPITPAVSEYASFSDMTSFLLIVDDFTRYTWCIELTTKKNLSTVFSDFLLSLKTRFPKFLPSTLITDQGTEFTNTSMQALLTSVGITHRPTPPHSPEANSNVERRMRTVKEGALSFIRASGLPMGFYSFALVHFTHINNLVQTRHNGELIIPWLRLYTRSSVDDESDVFLTTIQAHKTLSTMLSSILPFGACGFYVANTKPHTKVYDRGSPAIYLGFSVDTKRIRLLLPLGGCVVDAHVRSFDPFTTQRYRYCSLYSEAAQTSDDGLPDSSQRLLALVPKFQKLYLKHCREFAASAIESPTLDVVSPLSSKETANSVTPSQTSEGHTVSTPVVAVNEIVSSPSSSSSLVSANSFPDLLSVVLEFDPLPCARSSNLPPFFPFTESCSLPVSLAFPSSTSSLDPYTSCFVNLAVVLADDPLHPDFHQVMRSPDRSLWLNGPCTDEINSLRDRHVYDLVEKPSGAHVIGCRWVLTVKQDTNGVVTRRKARLVAQGFTQIEGRDFDLTYSEVTKCDALFIFLQMCAQFNLFIRQIDVKTAFLYAPLDRELYVRQPPMFDDKTGRVWKLNRALYGLKQAPRLWMLELTKQFSTIGFFPLPTFMSIFKRDTDSDSTPIFIVVYVDDILIAHGNSLVVDSVVREIRTLFEISDLGDPSSYLSLHLERLDNEIRVDSRKSIRQLLSTFTDEIANCTLSASIPQTPFDAELASRLEFSLDTDLAALAEAAAINRDRNLTPQDTNLACALDSLRYKRFRSAVGSLNFLVTRTRPDIALATSNLRHRYNNPRNIDWKILLRVLKYLSLTTTAFITFRHQSNPVVKVYSDASHFSTYNTRPQLGFILTYGDSPIIWKSKKDHHRITSIHNAEAYAITDASKYLDTVLPLFQIFGLRTDSATGYFYTDSESNVKNYQSLDMKSADHYLRNVLLFCRDNNFTFQHISGTDNWADLFTKPLPTTDFMFQANRMVTFEHGDMQQGSVEPPS